MPLALELRALVKRFEVGAGSCRASSIVLRGVDLAVETGELVTVSGPRGAGTSTLLLCAAGLLAADSGHLAWFGDRRRAAAVERALYVAAASTPAQIGPAGPSNSRRARSTIAGRRERIFLVDAPRGLDAPWRAWLGRRRSRGDTILLATHDDAAAPRAADRAFHLRAGLLHPAHASSARVAEERWRGAASVR